MVAVKDCRVSVELMKSLGGSDWSKLGEINDVDQSQGVTRKYTIAGKTRLTHDTDLCKLRLILNPLIMTSPGAHVCLHAEVFGNSLPSVLRPSDEYLTSHG